MTVSANRPAAENSVSGSNPSTVSLDCYGMRAAAGGAYNSVTFVANYTGTVTATGDFATGALIFSGGTLDQLSMADVTVTGAVTITSENASLLGSRPADFYWTGGTLNSTAFEAALNVTGTTAMISPFAGGVVSTGNSLNFTDSGGVGSALTVTAGTINFTNDTALTLGGLSSALFDSSLGNVLLRQKEDGTKWNTLGKTSTYDGGKAVTLGKSINPGAVMIKNKTTVEFTAPAGALSYDQTDTNATTSIENESMLKGNVNIGGGKLLSLYKAPPAQGNFTNDATIEGNLTFSGGAIGIGVNNMTVGSRLIVTGNMNWTGGVLQTEIDASEQGAGNLLRVGKALSVDTTGQKPPTVQILVINGPPKRFARWDLLTAKDGITLKGDAVKADAGNDKFLVTEVKPQCR